MTGNIIFDFKNYLMKVQNESRQLKVKNCECYPDPLLFRLVLSPKLISKSEMLSLNDNCDQLLLISFLCQSKGQVSRDHNLI